MPFALIIIGVVLTIAAVRNKTDELFTLVKGDFTGDNNYVEWVVAILIIGAIGYIESFKSLSRAFLVLVVLVLLISNRGFFTKFNQEMGFKKQ